MTHSESFESDIFEDSPIDNVTSQVETLSTNDTNSIDDAASTCDRKSLDEVSLDALRRSFRFPVGRNRQESTSLQTHPILDDNLQDFHQHRLLPGKHPLDVNYNMYGMVVSASQHLETFISASC